jgi:histidinol phosphatase-like PHP family hydrolase
VPRNSELAELLAVEAESAAHPAKRALRRASRRAFLWEVEAAQLLQKGRSLTELSGVGPYIEKKILTWLDNPPSIPETPPIRRGFLALTDARREIDEKPGWLQSIRGDLQMHTTWSDGSGSIAEMADVASERHYEYVAITDHSKGLKIAGGIDEIQLQRQAVEIEAINATRSEGSRKTAVLRSIELNLNPLGQGDMDHASLQKLDLVLGCFHSSLRKKDDQTDRYLAALHNPNIHILGHPRGRIYNFRTGLHADWAKIFATAAELDKALEIDGYPDRQDLDVDLLRIARVAGMRISLGTDSHGPGQLRFMEFAAAAALMAGIRNDRILNFMSKDELLAWADNVRSRTHPASRQIRNQNKRKKRQTG